MGGALSAGRGSRTPCIVGAGQVVARTDDPRDTEPLELWAEAAGLAAADSGAPGALRTVGQLRVVRCDSWSYDDPAGRLAARLGIDPARTATSGLGGTAPQELLHDVAGSMARGDLDAALIVSGEALHSVRAAGRGGEPLPWTHAAAATGPPDLSPYFHPGELAHGILPIMRSFALRDVARRARLGLDPARHEEEPARLYASMSRVASANPAAWHREARTADEILAAGPQNPMPVHPYRKLMMASPHVNMAAALLVTTEAAADALSVDPARRIRISGWGAADDFPYVAQNEALWRSPGMARATAGALARAGTGVDELALFDLYSCFPAALRFAADALGVGLDDPRGLTVTGGMAAAGGPGSGYVTHALAQMTASLRDRPGASGLVTGLSAQMAAHTATVLTSGPAGPPRAGRGGGGAGVRPVALADVASGPGSLEAYAVACDREGHDEVAVAVCRLADRRRCYAVTRDPGLLELLVKAELVGTPVVLNRVRGENRFAAP